MLKFCTFLIKSIAFLNMKLSTLLKRLYEESEYTSTKHLAEFATEQLDKPVGKDFIDRNFSGKNTMEKLDVIFEELTKGLFVEDLLLAMKLIEQIKLNEIEQEQIL